MGHLSWDERDRRRYRGRTKTGKVYEQQIVLTNPKTRQTMTVRRIIVKLDKPTRDGDTELRLLTNLPAKEAEAGEIADWYRRRWNIETAFQEMTVHLNCEINALGHPPAALFGFCVAAACYNLFAITQAALRSIHGEDTIENDLSHYYLADELSGTHRGMMIAVGPEDWSPFQSLPPAALARQLLKVARHVDLTQYKKQKRGSKKPKPSRSPSRAKHFSTAKLLADQQPP